MNCQNNFKREKQSWGTNIILFHNRMQPLSGDCDRQQMRRDQQKSPEGDSCTDEELPATQSLAEDGAS